MTLNSYSCIGNLGADPEIRYLESGKAVASFSVAIQQGRDQDPLWLRIECWDKLAQVVADYARKGDRIGICGRLRPNDYTDRETGEVKRGIRVTAYDIQLLGDRREESSDRGRDTDRAPARGRRDEEPRGRREEPRGRGTSPSRREEEPSRGRAQWRSRHEEEPDESEVPF